MAAPTRDNRNRFDRIIEQIDLMQHSYVIIGFQEGTVTRDQTMGNRHKQGGQSMADIAAQNEFGTARIPARPFMRTSFDENRTRLSQVIARQYGLILDGNSTVRRSLGLMGLFMQDLVVAKIREIQNPPNSPRTIARKGSSKPLIDFGQMVSAVTYRVVLQ